MFFEHALIEQIKNQEEIRIYRPWGYYMLLEKRDNYALKLLVIYPKQSTSYQSHNYRSEKWYIAKGEANIIKGEKEIKLTEGDTIFINLKEKHRITNNNPEKPLFVFEVQQGDYISEADITRYADDYGR